MSATTSRGTALLHRVRPDRRRARVLAALALCSTALAACEDASAPPQTDAPPALRYSAAAAPGSATRAASDVIPDEYVVVFHDSVQDVSASARDLAAANGATVRFTYTSAFKGFAAHMSAAAADALQRNPRVSLIEPDLVVQASDVDANPGSWGIDRIDQRSLPLSGSYSFAQTGAGVNVYIIDTGIRTTHYEFGGRAAVAYDALGGDGQDCNGHGTHVAGTVGGQTVGVAKGVRLWAVRVLDCSGSGSMSTVVAGLDWLAKNRQLPAAANISLGGSYYSPLNTAVKSAVNAGVTIAVAAGNSATDACTMSPASTPEALTVAASDNNDAQAYFSNWGSCVDLFAPGVNIMSSWMSDDVTYLSASGTSMATPHVAGVAALYLQTNPGASPTQVASAMLGATTTGVLNSVTTGTPNKLLFSDLTGGGTSPTPPPTSPPPAVDAAPTASFTAQCKGNRSSCTFDASASGDDVGIVSYDWNFGVLGATLSGSSKVVVFNYTQTGTYTVTLRVTDTSGQWSTTQQTVRVRRM